jgi:hypothetical protein
MTIETKYNIGDEVWWKVKDGYDCGIVCCIVIWGNFLSYQIAKDDKMIYNKFEENLFPTKEELLKSL